MQLESCCVAQLGDAIATLAARLHAATCALHAGLDHGTIGDRYQVVLHVDAADAQSACHGASQAPDHGQAAVELDDGAINISAETSRRFACDASFVVMRHAADGSVLDVGRKTRTIPPASAARCWRATAAASSLLCRRHHRAVHEEGFTVVRDDDGALAFYRPDGTRLEVAPALPQCGNDDADAHWPVTKRLYAAPCWGATPLDIGWALDVLPGGSRRRAVHGQQLGGTFGQTATAGSAERC